MSLHKKKYLITMALPYANGDIHLGHLLEAVQTDIFVRFQKLYGNEAIYVCADDTHGTPIELSAIKQGITPEALIEKAYARHQEDYRAFSINFDIFYTTNSEENRIYAEEIFENLKKNGLITNKAIDQYFCEYDKRFLPDRFIIGKCPKCNTEHQYGDVCESCGATYAPTDLIEPHCIICSAIPVLRSSEHYYVDLTKCEKFLYEYVNRDGLLQDDMRNFVMSWIKDGLKEWCISRDGPYFGFLIPGSTDKYFYVWLDAPIGYISSTQKWCKEHNRSIDEFWSESSDSEIVHFIGKDIVYFHTLFWPVMLKNSEIKLPTRFFIHGFVTIQGEKMSKSRGTFILAREFIEKVKHPQAAEFLRFYYGSKLMPGSADIDFNKDEFVSKVNTILANNIGNLAHRTAVFCDRSFEGNIPDAAWDEHIKTEVDKAAEAIRVHYEKGEIKQAVERIQYIGNIGNKYYQDNKPWETIKTSPDTAATVMVTCVNILKALAVFLKPIVPSLSSSIELKLNGEYTWNDYAFSLRNAAMGKTEKLVLPIENEHVASLFDNEKNVSDTDIQHDQSISIETFRNVKLKMAEIVSVEAVPKSNKLLKLKVHIGNEERQIIAGLAKHYSPEQLLGKKVVVVANLKPAKLFGEISEGMVLAAENHDGSVSVITSERPVISGASVV